MRPARHGCEFSGCARAHFSEGLCSGHYSQRRRGSKLACIRPVPRPAGCLFVGCDRPHCSLGLCAPHAAQRRKGRPLAEIRLHYASTCLFPGCGKLHRSRGLCSGHLAQRGKGKALSPLRCPSYAADCSFPGCSKPHKSLGFCAAHWRQQRSGKPLTVCRRRTPGALCEFPGCSAVYVARGLCKAHWAKANPRTAAAKKASRERASAARRLAVALRRARKKSAPGRCTTAEWQGRLELYGGLCAYGAPGCTKLFEHIDHVVAIARGGGNWPANLRPACSFCNTSKGDKPLRDWAAGWRSSPSYRVSTLDLFAAPVALSEKGYAHASDRFDSIRSGIGLIGF